MTDRTLECPILKAAGIDIANGGLGEDNDWIKSLCVNCPFKHCVFDGKKRFDIQERNKEIARLSKSKTAKELSVMFGLSISTINKVKKEE